MLLIVSSTVAGDNVVIDDMEHWNSFVFVKSETWSVLERAFQKLFAFHYRVLDEYYYEIIVIITFIIEY